MDRGDDRYGAGCLTLFALPFALCGLGALYLAASNVWSWQQMRSWVPTPAEILQLELEEHRGDDATTYEVIAHYRYTYRGRTFHGDRVAISQMADNIGDFHQTLYRRLQDARSRAEPVTAFVNPRLPEEAVLHRDLRWLLTLMLAGFGLVFGGVGIGLLVGAVIAARKLREEAELKARYPTEPWRWQSDWAGGRIRGSNRISAYFSTGFALFWNLISWPALSGLPRELERGNHAALLALLFPAIGIGLVIWAIRAWLRLRRYGVSTLVLASFPVPLGGQLKASLRATAEIPVGEAFHVSLSCIEKRRRRSGRRSSTTERVLWQEEQLVPRHGCQISPGYTTIPIEMRLPADQPPTSDEQADHQIFWRLEVDGDCPGPDYASRFDLPVFDVGGATDAHDQRDAELVEPRGDLPDLEALERLGILVQRQPDGAEQWVFSRARHKRVASGVSVFTAVWTGITAALFYSDAPLLFPIVFGLFAALMLWACLSLWLTEQRFTVGAEGITLRSGFFGKRTEIPASRIKRITPTRGMQAGKKLYYDLKIETRDKRQYVAARALPGLDLARRVAAYVEASLSIRHPA